MGEEVQPDLEVANNTATRAALAKFIEKRNDAAQYTSGSRGFLLLRLLFILTSLTSKSQLQWQMGLVGSAMLAFLGVSYLWIQVFTVTDTIGTL